MSIPDVHNFLYDIIGLETPDDSIKHAYDPAKAKAYYEAHKKLKGRKKAAAKPAPKAKSPASIAAAKKAKAARIVAARKKRIAELQVRLDKLEATLKTLSEQFPDSRDANSKNSSSKSGAKDRKPLTAAQKRDAAKQAAERREKESDPSLSAQEKTLEAKVKRAQERIAEIKAKVAASKKRSNG